MMRAIYTCLFGDYDILQKAPSFNGWDAFLFTDKIPKDSMGWKVIVVEKKLSDAKESRRYKFLSHVFLPQYDLVCYIDANMIMIRQPPMFPVWYPHPTRKNVVSEANRLIDIGFDKESVVNHVNYMLNDGFLDNYGLFENGFFVRSNRSSKINKLMELTFDLCEKYCHRDQLSLPYACWKLNTIPEGLNRRNLSRNFVRIVQHVKKPNQNVNVHHITPARSDKNFGKAINMIIDSLPDNDWICLRDIDTFPPYHEAFIKQIEELANNPQGYDLIGCMTNRLGLQYQLVEGYFEEKDISKHRQLAKNISDKKTIKALTKGQTVGGLMMLFSKKTWLKAGKFPEGGIAVRGSFIDYHFSMSVNKFGKCGIAEGVYLFHNYRPDSSKPTTYTAHLK